MERQSVRGWSSWSSSPLLLRLTSETIVEVECSPLLLDGPRTIALLNTQTKLQYIFRFYLILRENGVSKEK